MDLTEQHFLFLNRCYKFFLGMLAIGYVPETPDPAHNTIPDLLGFE